MKPRGKKSWLVPLPLLATVALALLIIVPWAVRLDLNDPILRWVAPLSAAIWTLIVCWSLYQLTFQIGSFFHRRRIEVRRDRSGDIRFAVLYVTCDDFQEDACLSCLRQNYPATSFQVLVCDDGSSSEVTQRIHNFANENPSIQVIARRNKRDGFKAGNINYAVEQFVDEPWFLVIDADQVLPPDYLAEMAAVVRDQPDDVAFVQGGHLSDHLPLVDRREGTLLESGRTPTVFQKAMGLEIQIVYDRDLSLRETHGFLPFLGHGAALRRSAWHKVGRIPHVVSEDYAFSMELSRFGYRGAYAEHIKSWESYPKDFGSFLVRIGKFSGGTAELLRHGVGRFLAGPESTVAKVDFMMALSWYFVMPLVLLNTYLSAYVCHRLWSMSIVPLHPLLPYLFITMFLLAHVVFVSVSRNPIHVLRYWFWSTAVYCAAIPISTMSFLVGFFNAKFRPTPKRSGYDRPSPWLSFTMAVVGTLTIWLALGVWRSPFSPVLASHGLSYFAFLFSGLLDRNGPQWTLGRALVPLPSLGFATALVLMWYWVKL